MKSFHPESLGVRWKHSSKYEHVILDSNLLSVLAKGNLYPSSLLNCKEKIVLRHDLKRIAKFFSGTAENKKSGECYSAKSSHSSAEYDSINRHSKFIHTKTLLANFLIRAGRSSSKQGHFAKDDSLLVGNTFPKPYECSARAAVVRHTIV